MLRLLERHAVQELLRAGMSPRAIAKQYGVSRRTIERIRHEAAVTSAAVAGDAGQLTGRPRIEATLRAHVAEWLYEERDLAAGEVWRRLREAGTRSA